MADDIRNELIEYLDGSGEPVDVFPRLSDSLGESLCSFLSETEEEPDFSTWFDRLKTEKNAGRDAEICRVANLRKDTLTRLRKETGSAARDSLWALSFALRLTVPEAEELFRVCSKSLHTRYGMSREEIRRERAFLFFLEKEKYDLFEINEILLETGILPLGPKDS